MKKYCLIIVFFLCWCQISKAQRNFKGRVADATTGEMLIGANVVNMANGSGCISNNFGFFSIYWPADTLKVTVSYMGYFPAEVVLNKLDTIGIIRLNPKTFDLKEVTVIGTGRNPEHGKQQLSGMDIKRIPALLAEKDVIKSLQLLPGVIQNHEGSTNFSVRGGSNDQNLILLDGIPVYNVNHLFGFVSVFNPDIINHVSFYKGGIPARYGGRLSSVTDITLREGNRNRRTGGFTVGMLSSKFFIEGPLQKEKSSFIVAGRRTMYDLLLVPITRLATDKGIGFYYGDLTAKANFRINPNNIIYLSAYYGSDKTYTTEVPSKKNKKIYRSGWYNTTATLRWNNSRFSNVFSNVTLAYTKFKYTTLNKLTSNDTIRYFDAYYSGVSDLSAGWDVSFHGLTNHKITAGAAFTNHLFSPGISTKQGQSSESGKDPVVVGSKIYGQEINGYLEDVFNFKMISVNGGLRYSVYKAGDTYYPCLQPRITLTFDLAKKLSLSGGYNHMFQYLNLVTNSNLGMPTDLWLPPSKAIPPQEAKQWSAGLKYLPLPNWAITVEGFYKDMYNLTEYADGVVIRNQPGEWEDVLVLGKGKSKGVEFMLEKNNSKVNGWLSYTWSRSFRTFADIRQGETFPFTYDRPHNANLFVNYKLKKQRYLNANWTYSSGYLMSIATSSYYSQGQYILDLGQRNNYRTPACHHLDINYSVDKIKKRGIRTFSIGVYNVYARSNPFSIRYVNFDRSTSKPVKPYLETVGLLTFIVHFSYEFKFK